jgi:hypothetical protein
VVVDVILFSLQLRLDRQLRSTLGNSQMRPHPVRESVGNKLRGFMVTMLTKNIYGICPIRLVRRGKRALHRGGWTFVYS